MVMDIVTKGKDIYIKEYYRSRAIVEAADDALEKLDETDKETITKIIRLAKGDEAGSKKLSIKGLGMSGMKELLVMTGILLAALPEKEFERMELARQ